MRMSFGNMRGRLAHARYASDAIRTRFGPSILTAFRNREHVHSFLRGIPDDRDRELADRVAEALAPCVCVEYGQLMELAEAGEWQALREEARDWMGCCWDGPYGILADVREAIGTPGKVSEDLLDFLLQRDLFDTYPDNSHGLSVIASL